MAPDTPMPVKSRRTVNAAMASRGLRSAADLAADKPCGTRVRYYAGCRCAECRAANAAYEHERAEARARGEPNHIVSAERAKAHLAWLSSRGIGRKTAADAAKVAASVVSLIVDGHRLKIRAQTERRILAVTEAAAADRARIDGTETLRRLAELVACGYTKSRIASEIIGRPVRGLQIRASRVTARTAERVRVVYERLRYATPADSSRALEQLRELSEEGFHRARVARLLVEAAAARRYDPVDTGLRNGRLRQQAVDVVAEIHARLIGADSEPEAA